MQELLRNAVNGWQRYTDDGKYAVLFLGILLFYWYMTRTEGENRIPSRELLWKYAVLTAGLAIFPPTAVIWMKYQTRFYDYEWIWSAVPVTLVTAAGMAEIYLQCYRKYWKWKLWKPVGMMAAGLALIFLCGNLEIGWEQGTFESAGEEKASLVLDKVQQIGNTENICMWGPSEVLQYIRGLDGSIELLYGRNMWDEALNGYAYDTYAPELRELYDWMEQLGEEEPSAATVTYLEKALEYGVNCIVLPEGNEAVIEALKLIAKENNLQVAGQRIEGYEIIRIQ